MVTDFFWIYAKLVCRDWSRHKICVCLANWDADGCDVGPTGSVDLYKSRYTMVAKTQTRVSDVFKPPFRDLVTLRTGFVWPRLLFSLECPLLFVFPPRSTLRSTARSQSLFRVSIGARWWICIEGTWLKRKWSRCRRSCSCGFFIAELPH